MTETTHIRWIATGGTISGVVAKTGQNQAQYQPAVLQGDELLKKLPSLSRLANWSVCQPYQIGSQHAHFEHFLKLRYAILQAQLDDSIDAILVTHGTDTLEEALYFTYLTVSAAQLLKPVVFTASMLPFDLPNSDATGNLEKSAGLLVRWVQFMEQTKSVTKAACLGLVMNNKFIAPIHVCKQKSHGVNAFDTVFSHSLAQFDTLFETNSLIQYLNQSQSELGRFSGLKLWNEPLGQHLMNAVQQPVIELLYCHPGLRSILVSGLTFSSQYQIAHSVVLAAYGHANVPDYLMPTLNDLLGRKIRVVVASRTFPPSTSEGVIVPIEPTELDEKWRGLSNAQGLSLWAHQDKLTLPLALITERLIWVEVFENSVIA